MMKKPTTGAGKQLSVIVEDNQVKISIGLGLLAFAVQSAPSYAGWPDDWYIDDIRKFGKEFASALQREEEDGTTPIHRMFDKVALELLEQGPECVEEGSVEKGIEIAKEFMEKRP
ncbi:hypothetical protein HF272_13665 [Rhizobium leguminosarum]|uniref:hypothetical protein n=1 Tax=Rhizobium leguminosarum TaxID=384 RepID=UPI001C91A3E3|nr:hypothetical protein [Rhizobium leguminosarum]MBY2992477.1 hypothetical protein [Rhizobium leguminosarum]